MEQAMQLQLVPAVVQELHEVDSVLYGHVHRQFSDRRIIELRAVVKASVFDFCAVMNIGDVGAPMQGDTMNLRLFIFMKGSAEAPEMSEVGVPGNVIVAKQRPVGARQSLLVNAP